MLKEIEGYGCQRNYELFTAHIWAESGSAEARQSTADSEQAKRFTCTANVHDWNQKTL